MSQNYSGRVILILSVLAIALLAIFWPSIMAPRAVAFNPALTFTEKTMLKPGIDIVGGTSLLYQIKQPEGTTRDPQLAEKVMKALKRRIDPSGALNLIWRPQGADRLEIQMPLSASKGDAAKAQKSLEEARVAIDATNVSVADAIDALQLKNGKTRADYDKVLASAPEFRKPVLKSLAESFDAMQKARAARDPEAGDKAEQQFEDAKQKLATTNLTIGELDRVLGLKVSRATELASLRTAWGNYPERLSAIDRYLDATKSLQAGHGGLETSADLKKLLRGSGVLEFHILASPQEFNGRGDQQETMRLAEYQQWVQRLQTTGARVQAGDDYRWYEVDNPDEYKSHTETYNDRKYVLGSIRPEDSLDQRVGKWALIDARPTQDTTGAAEVQFQFDNMGGRYFADLTSKHVHHPMAIVLDGRVISAPNIQVPINQGSGVITGGGQGGFSRTELDYLVRMLSAGSLPAQLDEEPISERTVGSQLGEDNLVRGLASCGIGLIIVAIFLFGYYYRAGMVAFTAVLINIILICGTMAAFGFTFTLPGIAAIVLTIGTAVDANVLIFERLREEEHRGLPLRVALRNAYDRAFSAIVDSNMTTIITCFFLIMFGTEEVKGFGITLIIGIVTSLFTALFVTRTIFGIMIDHFGVRQLGSLPLSFPAWDKMLKPHVDWMGLAWIFYAVSAVAIVAGVGLFAHYARAGQVLDIEFASGTAVTFDLKDAMKQQDVRVLIEDESRHRREQGEDILPSPAVQKIGDTGATWEVTTAYPDARKVRDAVVHALGDRLKSERPSMFQGVGETSLDTIVAAQAGIVLPLTPENISPDATAKWPGGAVPAQAKDYAGGAAIFLHKLEPALSPEEISNRIKRQVMQAQATQQQQQLQQLPRDFVVVSAGAPDKPVTEAVVLTRDEALPVDKDLVKWQDGVVKPMWALINDAVAHPPQLQQVKNFDKSVAGDTQRDALIALGLSVIVIMAYIWIRFGNLKYGTATVIALLHDVFFTIAALGLAHFLANTWLGDILKLEPFRINLTVVAGILTIMGYSMIDTIVVFDRIRENRGKYGHLNRQVINDAVTQTLSRTLLTAGTTTVMVMIMYFIGGSGIHGFTFVLLIGILVGTYSSIFIASPFLLLGKEADQTAPRERTANRLQKATT